MDDVHNSQAESADESDGSSPESSPESVAESPVAESKWRRLVEHFRCQEVSGQQSVDFFNSAVGVCWPADGDTVDAERRPEDAGEDADDARQPPPEEQRPSVGYRPASYLSRKEWHLSIGQVMVVPSQRGVTLQDKLPDDQTQFWSPEEDGLYVGLPPHCSGRQWNVVERRLHLHSNKKWFRPDGSLAVLADPLHSYVSRNILDHPPEQWRPVYLHESQTAARGPGSLDRLYRLHLFAADIRFTHHALFNEEWVVQQQLRHAVEAYQLMERNCSVELIRNKLDALHQAHDSARQLLGHIEANSQDDNVISIQQQRVTRYREAIDATRSEYYWLCCRRRRLSASILNLWRRLKQLRIRQGFASTTCKLIVRKIDNGASRQRHWDDEIDRQIEQHRQLFDQQFRQRRDTYRQQLDDWKCHRKEAKKRRQERRRRSPDSDPPDDDSADPGEKPQPPADEYFDEVSCRQQIVQRMNESLTPPGEPDVSIELIETAPGSSIDAREQRRLELMSRCRYQLKVYFNRQEVASSQLVPMNGQFQLDFQQAFHLWIHDRPLTLTVCLLQIGQKGAIRRSVCLSDIHVPFPDAKTSFADAPLAALNFSSTVTQPPIGEVGAVGSGVLVRHSASGESPSTPADSVAYTSGLLRIQCGWGTDSDGRISAPPVAQSSGFRTLHVRRFDVGADIDYWVNQVQLDPNDPANVEIFDKIEKCRRFQNIGSPKDRPGDDPATAGSAPDGLEFCSRDELDSDLRFQLLERRAGERKPFVYLTMIPNRSAEIPHHLSRLLLEPSGGLRQPEDDDEEGVNPLDAIRARGKRHLLRIRSEIADRLTSGRKTRLQRSDLIIEDHIPDISTFGGHLLPAFKPHRPLCPVRKDRPIPASGLSASGDDFFLRCNIIRAVNVPTKSMDGLHPFVQVSFQKSTARTTAANGSSPTWNQELSLPIRLPEGLQSPAALQTLDDDLYVQLFDEKVVDLVGDDRERDVSVHQRYERNWLGGIRIPFASIYKWNKIEGTFPLDIPFVPFGYEFGDQFHSPVQPAGTLLTVLISMDPTVAIPRPLPVDGPSLEEDHVIRSMKQWRQDLNREVPECSVDPLVLDEDGRSVYVGRFLTPLRPPEELTGSDDEETIRSVTAFVAAIPCTSNSHHSHLPSHIWLSSQRFLELLNGTEEDHAVLLFNYLSALNCHVYLVLGIGVPEGQTAQVLYKERSSAEHRYWMINAVTGRRTDVRDSTSSLQQVWAVLNGENMWANVQPKRHPSQLHFNLSKAAHWRPLFGRQLANPRPASVQPEALEYRKTPMKQVRRLEEAIADQLKQSFMKWRKTLRTKWNRHAGNIFRDMLIRTAQTGAAGSAVNLDQLDTYKIFGVPLSVPYTDVESLGDLLYSTGLHRHHGTEFALAVYVLPMPNLLLSVYLYCAYLESQ